MKSKSQVFCLLIALLTVAVASLEAPELTTLTNDVSNDSARIESTQEEVLRWVSVTQSPAESLDRHTSRVLPERDFKVPHSIPPSATAVKAGSRLLHLIVVQRK